METESQLSSSHHQEKNPEGYWIAFNGIVGQGYLMIIFKQPTLLLKQLLDLCRFAKDNTYTPKLKYRS